MRKGVNRIMSKSFKKKDFYEDLEYDDFGGYGCHPYKKSKGPKNDKKMEIQRARKKAQAERDAMAAEYAESSGSGLHDF